MSEKKTILVFGDSPVATTGFGTVNLEVWSRLRDKYNLFFLGVNDNGDPHPLKKIFNIFPTVGDPYGRDRLHNILLAVRPDLLFTLNDYDALTWVPKDLIDARNRLNKDIPWVSWMPVDGKPVYKEYVELMKNYMDVPITISEWGQKAILETDPDFEIPYIYHAVDTSVFKPLDVKFVEEKKKKLKVDGKFLIVMVGVNQIRKQYNIAVEAFAEFAKDKEDAMLHLHTTRDTNYGWNLGNIINYLSEQNVKSGHLPIDKRVNFTSGIVGPMGIHRDDLVLLYNLADVFMNVGLAEGFGVPLLEAMACEKPVIYHNVTSMTEVVGDAGVPIGTKMEYFFPFGDRSLRRSIPDKDQVVEALNDLYKNKKKRIALGKKGRERVLGDPRFNWDYCVNEIDKKLQEALEDNRVLDLSKAKIL